MHASSTFPHGFIRCHLFITLLLLLLLLLLLPASVISGERARLETSPAEVEGFFQDIKLLSTSPQEGFLTRLKPEKIGI